MITKKQNSHSWCNRFKGTNKKVANCKQILQKKITKKQKVKKNRMTVTREEKQGGKVHSTGKFELITNS